LLYNHSAFALDLLHSDRLIFSRYLGADIAMFCQHLPASYCSEMQLLPRKSICSHLAFLATTITDF